MKTYESKRQLADRYGISVSTVENLLRRIRDLIGDRYPRDAVTHCGRIIRIRSDVFDDLLEWGDAIDCGAAPPYRDRETAYRGGWMHENTAG